MGKEPQKNLLQPNQKPYVGVLLLVILPFSASSFLPFDGVYEPVYRIDSTTDNSIIALS
jgi:hypothetical protein